MKHSGKKMFLIPELIKCFLLLALKNLLFFPHTVLVCSSKVNESVCCLIRSATVTSR